MEPRGINQNHKSLTNEMDFLLCNSWKFICLSGYELKKTSYQAFLTFFPILNDNGSV